MMLWLKVSQANYITNEETNRSLTNSKTTRYSLVNKFPLLKESKNFITV
jgi:hypothetical protein